MLHTSGSSAVMLSGTQLAELLSYVRRWRSWVISYISCLYLPSFIYWLHPQKVHTMARWNTAKNHEHVNITLTRVNREFIEKGRHRTVTKVDEMLRLLSLVLVTCLIYFYNNQGPSALVAAMGFGIAGYFATDLLIPRVGKSFIKIGLFGKDLSKPGRPVLPETIGAIPAVFICLLCSFTFHSFFTSIWSLPPPVVVTVIYQWSKTMVWTLIFSPMISCLSIWVLSCAWKVQFYWVSQMIYSIYVGDTSFSFLP